MARSGATAAFLALSLSSFGGTGCGLESGGLGALDAGADALLTSDANLGLDADASDPCASDAIAACTGLPTTAWAFVAVDATHSAACPAGFGPAADLLTRPQASMAACVCPACTTAPPTCATGPIDAFYSDANTSNCSLLGTPPQSQNVPAGGCNHDMYVGNYSGLSLKLVPPKPTGGSCSGGVATQDSQKATSDTLRVCALSDPSAAGCGNPMCAPSVPAPFKACVQILGEDTCPASFPNRNFVGTGISFDCGPCACTFSASCTGTMTIYEKTNCSSSGATATVAADGQCHFPSLTNDFAAYKYASDPPLITCSSTPPVPSNVALSGESTVCCP